MPADVLFQRSSLAFWNESFGTVAKPVGRYRGSGPPGSSGPSTGMTPFRKSIRFWASIPVISVSVLNSPTRPLT